MTEETESFSGHRGLQKTSSLSLTEPWKRARIAFQLILAGWAHRPDM